MKENKDVILIQRITCKVYYCHMENVIDNNNEPYDHDLVAEGQTVAEAYELANKFMEEERIKRGWRQVRLKYGIQLFL